MRGVDRFERGGISRQSLRLLRQPECNRVHPCNVRAPVHVITDPSGKTERQRIELVPTVGPFLLCCAQYRSHDAVARILCVGHRGHRAFVLVAKRDLGFDRVLCRRRRIARKCALCDCRRLRGCQQERGVRCEDRVHARVRPCFAKGIEIIARVARKIGQAGSTRFGVDQSAQARSTCIQRTLDQSIDQPFDTIQRHLAAFQRTRQIMRQLENGVEKRRLTGPLME